MHVLVISILYPNSRIYSSGIFVHEQVKALIKAGVKITVIAPVPFVFNFLSAFNKRWKSMAEIPEFEKIENVDIYHPRYIALPKGFLKNLWPYPLYYSIKNLIDKKFVGLKFDLIHAHGALPNDYAAYLLSKKLNLPYVLTVHGATVNYKEVEKKRFKKSAIAIKKASIVTTVSNKTKRRIEKYSGRNNEIITIYNGYKTNVITESGFQKKAKIDLLYAGNLWETKGIFLLLEVYKTIVKKREDVFLHIVGGGKLREKVEETAKRFGVANKLKLYGILEHDKLLSMMKGCDIFVLPSWDEALGVVYLEAMSFQKPVIGVEGEGISELIEDGVNGFLAKPKDVESLTEKLLTLINNETLRKEIGVRGKETIQELTWKNNAKKYIEIYRSLIDVKR